MDNRLVDHPWFLLSNFSIIREDRERVGGCPPAIQAMNDFNICIDACGLVELNYHGNHLSWYNDQERIARKWAQLDRALISMAFSASFPLENFEYIKRKTSDHSPLVVTLSQRAPRCGPSPFMFQKMWYMHESFQNFVKEVWYRPVYGLGLIKLAAKLKHTKIELRGWNNFVFGQVDQNIKELEDRLELLESQLLEDYFEDIENDYLVTKLEHDVWEKRKEARLEISLPNRKE